MSNQSKSWITLIVLACIWGSSFILMKKGMFTSSGQPIFSDSQVAGLRMTIAALSLLPFAISAARKLNSWRQFILLTIVGTCGNFIPSFLFTYAETGISSGYAGMLNSCTPIFALLIGVIIFHDKLSKIQYLGVAIGTIGVICLVLAGSNSSDLEMTGNWTHIMAIIIATLCYAISLNTIKHTLSHLKSVEIASLSFLIIFAPSIIITLQQGTLDVISNNTFASQGLLYIGILSVIGTAFALILFNKLVAISSVLFASSVTYLIPIVAMIIGIYFGEKINSLQIISMGVVIAGIFIANVLGKKTTN
ncbi:MAG: DMT family transporter [Crocinitomicaceae bacterium]|nr:DMT family transporter [Crocinitomicaceae bacterium]